MWYQPGVTRCPACGRAVTDTDDTLAVRRLAGGPAAVRDGVYHYRCFRRAAFHTDQVAALRPAAEVDLGPPEDRTLLGRTADFALTREAYTDEYRLHALAHARCLTLTRTEVVRVVRGVVGGAGGERVRIERATGGVSLFLAVQVPLEVEFAPPAFARLRQLLPPLGPQPSAAAVNLPALCDQLRIAPVALSGALSAALGPVLRAEGDDGGRFTLLATRWHELDLTEEQFAQLQELGEQVLLAL